MADRGIVFSPNKGYIHLYDEEKGDARDALTFPR